MRRLYVSLAIRSLGLVILCGLLYVALFPHTAAACATWDIKCPVDVGTYSAIVGVSELLWKFNRMILWAARWVEGLRVWLITNVLGTALDATIAGVKFPFWIAVGVAWIVFVVSFMLQAIVQLNWVDLRRGIRNAILAVILFQIGSPAMASLEQVRVTIGQGFSNIAATSIGNAQQRLGFYAGSGSESQGDSLDRPKPLYAGDTCGLGLQRDQPGQMYMNDYIAAYLFADAKDIHCPPGVGFADLPQRFQEVLQIRDISDESDRDRLILYARFGLARQAQAVLPSIGAVLEQVMHLVFALALASLWFGLVISLIFSLFVPLEGMFKNQIDGMIATLKKSWLASFWVGLALALIDQAGRSGNSLVLNAVSMGMFVVVFFQTRGALTVLRESMGAASTSLGQAPAAVGGAFRGVGNAIAGATRFGVQAATVGGALALGGGPELGEQLIQQARRRLTFSNDGNLLVQAAQRTLLDHAMGPVEEKVRDAKDARAVARGDSEMAWYERKLADQNTPPEEKDRALRRTAQIEGEQGAITARQLQRQLRYAREHGNWNEADRLMADTDSRDQDKQDRSHDEAIERLERERDAAALGGDVRKASTIQSRIDALRGASAAATIANGMPQASRDDAIGAPLAPGLGEIAISRGTDGQLRVNGRRVDGASAVGGKVVLSVAGQAVTLDDPDDYERALQLPAGGSMDVQAQIRGPVSSRAAVDAPASPERAVIQTRIEQAEARVAELSAVRNQALEAKEWDKAHTAIAEMSTLKGQIAADRQALTAIDRTAVQMRVPGAPIATSGSAQLAPDTNGAPDGAAIANDLAYEPPPGATAAPIPADPAATYQQSLAARRGCIEQRERRLTELREQHAQIVNTHPEQAEVLAQRIAQAEQYQRQDQETYNRIAARPPMGAEGVPQIVVGAPGLTVAPAAASAPVATAPQAAAPQVVAAPQAAVPQPVALQAAAPQPAVPQAAVPPPIETPATPLRPDMVPPSVAAGVPPPPVAARAEVPRQAGWMPPQPAVPAGPVAPAETPATPLRPDMVPPGVVSQYGGPSGTKSSISVQNVADRLADKTQGAGGSRQRPWKNRGSRPRGPGGTRGNGGTQ